MANKISVIIDATVDKAVSGLKGFKQSVNDADGAVGKFKAGASSAFDSVKANAGNMAMVAGAAIVTFGAKSVAAFQDSALSAGKFADATGLSTEAASRWVAVADDIGISGETMEKTFGKLAVSVGKNNPLLEEYGITVKRNAQGQLDMNATMLNAIDMIKGIEDPTKKAAVAQAAFGKGWMDMAELIDQGSASLATSMAAVSEAQVIDPEEVEKARKMRAAMDELQDSVRDVALVIGEDLVPMVTMAADVLVGIIGPLSDVNQWSKAVTTSWLEMIGVIDRKEPIDASIVGFGQLGESLDATTRLGQDHIEMQEGMQGALAESTDATEETTKSAIDYEGALESLNDALDERIAATNKLVGGDIAVRDSQREAAAAVRELTAAEAEGLLTADELSAKLDETALSLIGAAEEAAAYDETLANAAGQTLTATQQQDLLKAKLGEVASTLAPGSPLRAMLEGYVADLNSVPPEISTRFTITARGATVTPHGDTISNDPFKAAGGPVSAGSTYIVGEQGPELLTMGGNGYVTPNSQLGGGSGGSPIHVTVNAGLGANGKEIGDIIVSKIREYERRNGNGWRG